MHVYYNFDEDPLWIVTYYLYYLVEAHHISQVAAMDIGYGLKGRDWKCRGVVFANASSDDDDANI